MLIYFKYCQIYIWGQLCQRKSGESRENLNYVKMTRYSERFSKYINYQNDKIFIKISELYQVQNVSILSNGKGLYGNHSIQNLEI